MKINYGGIVKSFILLSLFLTANSTFACPNLSGFFIRAGDNTPAGSISITQYSSGNKTGYDIAFDGSSASFEIDGKSSKRTEKYKDDDGNIYTADETMTCTDANEFVNEVLEQATTTDGEVLYQYFSTFKFSLDADKNLHFVKEVIGDDGTNYYGNFTYVRQ